jgi:hypothetical protein
MAIWYNFWPFHNFWPFGILCRYLVYFYRLSMLGPRIIWQPCKLSNVARKKISFFPSVFFLSSLSRDERHKWFLSVKAALNVRLNESNIFAAPSLTRPRVQGCQIFLYLMYQIGGKCIKLPLNNKRP